MINRPPTLELANRVQMTFVAMSQVIDSWVPYLLDSNLDREISLRNKAFTITINGLTDACENYDSRINGLRIEARKLNNDRALYYIGIVKSYIEGAIDLLSVFNRNEMIFIIECRHQSVHGHLANMHKSSRGVKYVENRKIVAHNISDDEYWAAYRSVHNNRKHDDALIDLRRKFYSKSTLFWPIDNAFRDKQVQALIYDDIINPRPAGPLVEMTFHPEGYWKTIEIASHRMMNLYQVSDILNYPSPTIKDPVLHLTITRVLRRITKRILIYSWNLYSKISRNPSPPKWIMEFLRQ